MKHLLPRTAIAAFCLAAFQANAAVITVSDFDPTIVPGGGTWGKNVQGAGSATIEDLTGQGGNLENNQPLPTGAGLLTTSADNNDRGEVGISADFGDAASILNNLITGYAYFKMDNGPNIFAAPALKLSIFAAGGVGDNFGTLVYEPTWNQAGGGSQQPPTGDWQTVVIDANTGAGDDSSGGWWWTGGFEQANTAGGPPLRSTSEWANLFGADADFANARVVGINMGVGTFNQNQIGYFDEVVFGISGGQMPTVWDFEPESVPAPATVAIGLIGIASLMLRRRKANRQSRG